MRHLKSGRKLNRTASHRKAMFNNMAVSLFDKERITTTTAKAKELRGVVARLITYGKKGTIYSRRLAAKKINDKDVLKKLFEDIAPGYMKREGGYTRVIKLKNRNGDNAEMAIIELVGRHGDEPRKRKKKKKDVPKKSQEVKETQKVQGKEVKEKTEKKETKKKEGKKVKEKTGKKETQKKEKTEVKEQPEKKEIKKTGEKDVDTKPEKKEKNKSGQEADDKKKSKKDDVKKKQEKKPDEKKEKDSE